MIGESSAAYIRGRNDYLQQRPSRVALEARTELRKLYALGYRDARKAARASIVQLQIPLDSGEQLPQSQAGREQSRSNPEGHE